MDSMSDDLHALLTRLYEQGRAHDAGQSRHADTRRNLEPETAALVSMFVRSGGRRSLLEIGTSNGYSTIWLAWAALSVQGTVTSIEVAPGRHAEAEENLRLAGLEEPSDLRLGDAREIINDLSGPFDLVFFDADRVSAPAQLEVLLPKLAPDVLLLADNVLSHPEEIAGYLAMVDGLPDFDQIVVPVGKGLSVAYRSAGKPR